MKKLLLLSAIALIVISCEREIENIQKNETFEKHIKLDHEKNSNKSVDSDTIKVRNYTGSGYQMEEAPISDVDPKDINPPRR